MSILRLERVSDGVLDLALAAVDRVTLTRSAEGLFVEVAFGEAPPLVRALARAGVRATAGDGQLAPPAGLVAAIGRALEPLPRRAIALDVVRVRRVSIGEATAYVLRSAWPWQRPSDAARTHCRELLDGRDALLAWDRRAWCDRAAVRDRAVRAILRPVVFDRDALAAERAAQRILASTSALTRWAFQ